jgi:hypothetical protein
VASKQELSEQLDLTTKLAAQVERMAAAADKLDAAYTGQVDAVKKLADAFSQINAGGAVQGIEVLNKSLKDMQDKMKDTGKATESTFQKLGKKVEETGKTISTKFPKAVLIGTAALTGFKQGLSNVIALGKGITGFVGSFVDGLANITASIISIPFKMFEGLVDMAAKSAGGSNELAQAIEDLRKQFGALGGPSNKAIIDTSKSLKGFSDTGLSAWRVFGTMAERLNYMREMATEMGTSFNLLRKEMEDNGGAILAYRKGLGLSAEAMKAVAQKSDMMGVKSGDTLKDMTKYSYALGKALNLDAKVISREMGEAMKDMAHFGTTSTKSLGESVAFAHKFGLELKDITGTLDKFDSFDDAAEHAANLSQAFGVNIDSFEMMKAAAEGDVGKQTEILRKAFREQGVDASKFNNVQRALIRDNTGLSDAAIQSAFSMKKQGVSLKDAQKAGDKAQKQTMTQEQAMSQLADAIERMVKAGGGLEGGFWDQFLKGVKNGIMSTQEFYGMMRNIQISLREVHMIGVKLGRDLVKIVPGFGEILGGLRDFFKPGNFSGMFQSISDTVRRFFDPKSQDKGSVPKLLEGLKKSVTDMFTKEGTAGKKILDGFKTFFLAFSKIAADGIKFLADKLAEGAKFMVDLLTGKASLDLGGAGAAAEGGLGFLKQVIAPLGEALKHAWEVLKDPLWELVKTLVSKLIEFLKSPEVMGIIKPALGGLALVFFGPAFTRAIVGAITAAMAKAATEALVGAGKKVFSSLIGKAAEAATAGKKAAETGAGDTKGIEQVGAVNKAAGEAVNADKGSKWGVQEAVKLGLKLIAIATAIAIGGVEMAVAIGVMHWTMKKFGIDKPEDIYPQLLALGAMVVAAVPLMLALKIASKVGSPSEVIKGGAVIALAVGIVGLTAGILAGLLGLITTPSMLDAVGTIMLKMSLVFLAMVPLILASMVIGALASGPQAVLLGVAAVGLGAIAIAVAAMATTAVGIIEALNKLQIEPGFQKKIDAFLGVMKAIQMFTDSMVKVIELMQPTLIGFLTGTEEKFTDKINAAQAAIKTMIGEAGKPGGLVGMVETVMKQIGKINVGGPKMAEAAQIFGSVMTAMADVMKAMTPPDAFYEAGTGLLNKLANPTVEFADLTYQVGKYAETMRTQLMKMIEGEGGKGGILGLLKDLSGIKIPDAGKAKVVADMIMAIANVTKAITPDAETFKSMQDSGVKASYAWGLLSFDNKKEGVKPEGIAKIIQAKAEGVKTLIDAVTTGPMKAILDKADSIGADKLQGVNALVSVLKTVTDLTSLIANSTKGQTTTTIDQGKITTVTDQIPDLAQIIMKIGKALAPETGKGFVDYLIDAVRSMPTDDKKFMKDLDTAKTLFGFVGEIPKLAESLNAVGAGAGGTAPNTDPLLGAFSSVTGFLEKLTKGTGGESPLTKLSDSMTVIAFILSGKNSPESMVKAFGGLKQTFEAVNEMGNSFSTMTDTVTKATEKIGKDGVGPALDAVSKMVKAVNEMNTAMADPNLNKINLKARLENVAKAVGLGGKASYSVDTGKGVVITVNMHVTMDAGTVEKTIIENSQSIIANRINFATSQPTVPGQDKITPDGNYNKEIQPGTK